MNNECPTCGAVYGVAEKDIGRRLKCKKCGTRLTITEAGIEIDDAAGSAPAPAMAAAAAAEPFAEAAPPPRRPKAARSGGGFDAAGLLDKVGGVSTLVFGLGAFLIIVFTFMPLIGSAKAARKVANAKEAEIDHTAKIKRMVKDKSKEEEITKANKEHEEEMVDLNRSAEYASLGNAQSAYSDRYFLMFGFVFLMVGSLLFMLPEQPPIKRTVGAIVITAQMVLVFMFVLGRSAMIS